MFENNRKGFVPEKKEKQQVFISFSHGFERAAAFSGSGNSLSTAFENARGKVLKRIKADNKIPAWTCMDFVAREEKITIDEFYKRVNKTKINYFRYGIAFDDLYQVSFLEQEINGSALFDNKQHPIILHDRNITNALRKKGIITDKEMFSQEKLDSVIVFESKSCFYDSEKGEYYDLFSQGLEKGIRKTNTDENFWIEQIKLTGQYLNKTVKDDGSFIYGYYSCFLNLVPGYNIIRHILSVIALIDLYHYWQDASVLENIKKTFDFVMTKSYHEIDDNCAVIVDRANDNEIRLGALGLAVLMIVKYSELFNSEAFIPCAKKLANSIIKMQDEEGNFVHVLQFPDMSVKKEFQIVYYSGEACYGLLALYEKEKEVKYLQCAERAFNYFIQEDYYKYSDHWLAYAVNEITKHKPEDKYFDFGIKNAMYRIDFIIDRLTTWATFLEMLNATNVMFKKIRALGKEYLFKGFDKNKFDKAVEIRALRQLNGVMFPEMAMFFKYPAEILYGSYIRHHSFRIRNDDVAHHIIGYCNYLKNKRAINEQGM